MTEQEKIERIEELVELHYDGGGRGRPLAEFLGMTEGQYEMYERHGQLPGGYDPPTPCGLAPAVPETFWDLARPLLVMLVVVVACLVFGFFVLVQGRTRP